MRSNRIYIFWDTYNDSPIILDEAGEFYYYGEDHVAIYQKLSSDQCRYWNHMDKLTFLTPLNEGRRYDIFDSVIREWYNFAEARVTLVQDVQRHAGVRKWWCTE